MSKKRDALPALQLYPGDWRKDPGVQALTFEQRGIWFEMLCVMHESERRGTLVLNGKPMRDEQIAQVIGCEWRRFRVALETILDTGVASRDDTGAVINRRMVKDEHIRQVRKASGSLGGNPNLVGALDKQNTNLLGDLDNQKSNHPATPSSSSSVSTSENLKALSGKPDDVRSADKQRRAQAVAILDHLNAKAGKRFEAVPANINLITARLKEGATPEKCSAVIDAKCAEWLGTEYARFLQPGTLFNRTKFAQYVGNLGAAAGQHRRPAALSGVLT